MELEVKNQIRIEAFPLEGIDLVDDFAIADHVNLSGSSPKLGFNPVAELYIAKHDPNAVVVACLKPGTTPNQQETEVLISSGVKAYSYNLLEPALYAAAKGEKINALGYVPKVPKGFNLFGISAGIKQNNGAKDLGLIYSNTECAWAATFTKNLAKAICVENNQRLFDQSTKIRALISNSGNANACTGAEGEINDKQLRETVAQKFHINPSEVLSASTGKIGVQLPIDKIISSIHNFGKPQAQVQSIIDFAESMLTTDLVMKISQDSNSNILGFTKGSGMIMPNMATMLAYMISDVKIRDLDADATQKFFRESLSEAVNESFNLISVDGDTSTNDMVIFMSNLQGKEITQAEFKASLSEVCKDLAYKIIADGEGVTKIIKLNLSGLADKKNLEIIGRKIINSPLVKTAIFGNDPNWGRIIASAGQAAAENNIDLDMSKVKLSILGYEVFATSTPSTFIQAEINKAKLVDLMRKSRDIVIDLDLGPNQSQSLTVFGNDLSHDYIKINAEYTT